MMKKILRKEIFRRIDSVTNDARDTGNSFGSNYGKLFSGEKFWPLLLSLLLARLGIDCSSQSPQNSTDTEVTMGHACYMSPLDLVVLVQ